MKGPPSPEDRTARLVEQLTSTLDSDHGTGSMAAVVYDTAWLAMVSKPLNGSAIWRFPQCFRYILDHQQEDGGWPSYASAIDGILNTAASLLCLQKHCASGIPSDIISRDEVSMRVNRATLALQRLLDGWDVASTVHVGFEILVPAILDYIRSEGISFTFPGIDTLQRINQEKLKRFKPEYLYSKAQLTAVHSLEAFIGKLDFDKLSHHKVRGSFMASPSSTAAHLMNTSKWDDECEDYLQQVIDLGAGAGSGGVPSAWPSTTFETTWVVSTLLDASIDVESVLPQGLSNVLNYLHRCIESGKGVTGFAPGLGADADDTAKTILILNLLDKPTSPAGLVKQFEDESCFKTYPLERDPSFSANVNCLIALLHAPDPTLWIHQISKIINFLCSRYEQSGVELQDKWNISPYYSMMLLSQALSQTLRMAQDTSQPAIADAKVIQRITTVMQSILEATLRSCNDDGSWGQSGLREETAYAAIALASVASVNVLPERAFEVQETLRKSRAFLHNAPQSEIEYLWVEKVTFGSKLLSEAYVLAALNLCSKADTNMSNAVATGSSLSNGTVVSDRVLVNLRHENGLQVNGSVNGEGCVPGAAAATNGTHVNGSGSNRHVRMDSVMNQGVTIIPNALDSQLDTDQETERILLGPYDYLDKNPGKDIRGAFIAAFNTWLHVPNERLAIINKVVRMLHTSSLLVDDIEDNSDLRRGIPVAHSIFGIPQTFNSANYVYFQALKEVRGLRNEDALDVFVEELLNLHRGQGLDLYWRDSLTCPTEEQYLDMVGNKTGGLFRLAIRLMQAESSTGRDVTPLVSLLGLQFQVCDDYLNLKSNTYTTNKGFCEDLTEGKFSFPVIHSIHADPTNKELLNILKQKPHEVEIKKYAVGFIEQTGSFAYTRHKVAELKAQVLDLVAECEEKGWGDAGAIRKLVSRLDIS